MARELRIAYQGATYHVVNRGIDRRPLYREDADFERVTENLQDAAALHQVLIHAYVLLSNHFHLLVTTPHANLSAFMRSLETRYAVYDNRKYRKSGHMYQGRYKPLLVEENEYLLWVGRYIHLNPVQIKAFKDAATVERKVALRAYRWSSYPDYLRPKTRRPWLACDLLESQVGGRGGSRAYRGYVESGLAANRKDWEEEIRSARLGFGSESFVERVQEQYESLVGGGRNPEDVSTRTSKPRVPAEAVIAASLEGLGIAREDLIKRRGGGPYRGVVALMLVKFSGLTQREAARHPGMNSGASVNMRLRHLEEELKEDKELRAMVQNLESRMKGI